MGLLEHHHYEYIDEEIFVGEINGLKTYVVPKKGFSKYYAMLTVKYGSKDIKFSINDGEMKEYPLGIAHFLEHKLFEEKEGNIFDRFALLGSSPNAFTNFNITSYYFTATNNFVENLRLLIKFVFNPYFTEENVEKEKGIIEQEIRMYEDNAGFRVYFNALEGMYKSYPVRYDIAGTVDSIRKITPGMLYDCYNAFYTPQNMALIVVGDVEPNKVEELAKELVPLDRASNTFEKYKFENEREIFNKDKYLKLGLSIPNFVIGFKEYQQKVEEKDILRKRVIMDIVSKMLFSKSSFIYERLYDLGLINDSFGYEYSIEKEYSHFILSGESKNPKEVMKVLLEELNKLKRESIAVKDLERMKKVLTGVFISKFNSIDGLGYTLNEYAAKEIDLFDYYELLKVVSITEIEEAIKNLFNNENCVLSIVD